MENKMARQTREIIENCVYHTFSRLHNKEDLMKPKEIKHLMELVLEMALEKYKFHLNNYALLDNHFHFMMTTLAGEANISTIMQFIKSQFAQRYNKMMNRSGSVWNERFGDTIIENSEYPLFYFLWLCIYIFYNPVRKNYVSDPRNYEFSCMGFYLDEHHKPRLNLTHSKYFINLGKTFKERVAEILKFEDMYLKKIFDERIFA